AVYGNLPRPGPRPRRRIVDRELVHERVGIDAGEPLHQPHARRGSGEARATKKVLRLDDERVAFPAAARASEPLWDAAGGLPAQRNDAGVVDHLGADRRVSWSLNDLHVVVVGARRHRRTGIEPEDATVRQRSVLVRVGAGTSCLIVAARGRPPPAPFVTAGCWRR